MSKSSDKRRENEDLKRAEQGGTIDPEDQPTDPANTGPAGSNPDADPAGSASGETASSQRAERRRRGGK